MRKRVFAALSAAVGSLGLMPAAFASTSGTSIGVQFGIGSNQQAGTGPAPALSPSQVAGVVPSANWNVVPANASSGTLNNLVQDSSGTAAATGVSVTWTTNDNWDNGGNNGFTGADNTLNYGYLDGGNTQNTTVTFSGLTPGQYNVYVTSVDQHEPTKGGSIDFNGVNDNATSTLGNVGGPNYVQATPTAAGNYHLEAVTIGSNGQLVIDTNNSNNSRTPINSIELVPASVPEPASLGLVGAGMLGLTALRRRR